MSRVLGTALSSSQPVSCNAAPGLNALNPLHPWQGAQIPQAPLSPAGFSSTRSHRCPLFGHLRTVTPTQTWPGPCSRAAHCQPRHHQQKAVDIFPLHGHEKILVGMGKKKKKVDFSPSFTPEGPLRDEAYPKLKENLFVNAMWCK